MERARLRRGCSWGAAVGSAVSVIAALPMAAANSRTVGAESVYVVNGVIGMFVPLAGAFLLSRRPGHRIGWLLMSAVGPGVAFLGLAWSCYGTVTRPGALPWAAWAGWVAQLTWVPFLALVTLLPLWFPDGRLPGRGWLVLERFVLTLLGAVVVLCAIQPTVSEGMLPNPLVVGPDWTTQAARAFTTAAVVTAALGCVPSGVIRYRQAEAPQRLQQRWFVLAAGLAVATLFLPVPVLIGDVLTGSAFVLMAVAITAAVLRHRLYGITVAVRRTLVYGMLTLLSVVLYVAAVTAAGLVLPTGAMLVGTAAVAVAFAPLRSKLQRNAHRLLYGDRPSPYEALTRLAVRLERNLGPEEVPMVALDEVLSALQVPWAALVVDGRPIAVAGGPCANGHPVERIALVHRGEHVGALEIAWRRSDEPLTDRDHRLLTDLARPLAAALHATALTRQVQRSQEQLVNAVEEERRRLHRDLHDGIGPSLAALVLGMDAVAHAARRGEPADALVEHLKAEVRSVIAELRRVVYQLRPPALDELGLVAAVERHLATYQGPPGSTEVVLHAPRDLSGLPAAVEVAAYRIVAEAVTNAVRHAHAAHCDVLLELNGDLHVAVTDDGTGIAATATSGAGVRSVRERAVELGGECVVTRRVPCGTRVHAVLPVHRA